MGASIRDAIHDLVGKLFNDISSPSPTIMPRQDKVDVQIQREMDSMGLEDFTTPLHDTMNAIMQSDMDGMSLGDCSENIKADVPSISKSLSHASDITVQNTKRSDAHALQTHMQRAS